MSGAFSEILFQRAQERSQDALDPANRHEPHVSREMRLEAAVRLCIDRIEWGVAYAEDEIKGSSPHEIIGGLKQTLMSAMDDLEASL